MPTISQRQNEARKKFREYNIEEIDPHHDTVGVLLQDEIKYYVKTFKLIDPFCEDHLKPAAYELTVGDEFYIGGQYGVMSDEENNRQLIIPPFQVAIIKTAEVLTFPRYLIGRWNIRTRWAYKGLLWVGGPQVDPGYVGHLFCPIYNLSDKPVRISEGERIAVMDFVKTTPFDPNVGNNPWERYPSSDKRERNIIQDYGGEDLNSALFTHAGKKIEEFEKSIGRIEDKFGWFTIIVFTVLAILVSSTLVFLRAGDEVALGASFWGAVIVGLAFFALLISVFQFVGQLGVRMFGRTYSLLLGTRTSVILRKISTYWYFSLFLSLFIAGGAAIGAYNMGSLSALKMHDEYIEDKNVFAGRLNKIVEQIKNFRYETNNLVSNQADVYDAKLEARIGQLMSIIRELREEFQALAVEKGKSD